MSKKQEWRLIIHPPTRGSWNMAVDEAILEAVGKRDAPPTLRLYGWNPPCLSLGYAQDVKDVDINNLIQNKWDLVRRPTGGQAILHTDELTYAVIGTPDNPILSGSVLESYQRIAYALLKTLEILGLSAQSLPMDSSVTNSKKPICFEIPSNYEITANHKKIIGSAQARRQGGILQHGAIPLKGDLQRITQVLTFPDEESRSTAAQRLMTRATTIESILGKIITLEEASSAIIQAFEETLEIRFLSQELTPAEHNRASVLEVEKYACESWNYKKEQ